MAKLTLQVGHFFLNTRKYDTARKGKKKLIILRVFAQVALRFSVTAFFNFSRFFVFSRKAQGFARPNMPDYQIFIFLFLTKFKQNFFFYYY